MTVDEIVSKLDDHGFEDIETADKVDTINAVIRDICAREPWPFLEKQATIGDAEVGSDGKVTVSGGDLRAVLLLVDTTKGGVLTWQRWDEHTRLNANQLAKEGDPYSYFFKGDDLYVYPIPPSTTTLQLNYIKHPAAVAAGGSEASIAIPARHHRAIVLGCLVQLYFQDDDAEQAAGAKAMFEEYLLSMRPDVWKKQYDKPDIIYWVDEDYFDENI